MVNVIKQENLSSTEFLDPLIALAEELDLQLATAELQFSNPPPQTFNFFSQVQQLRSHPLVALKNVDVAVAYWHQETGDRQKFWVDAHIHSISDFAAHVLQDTAIPELELVSRLQQFLQTQPCLLIINGFDDSDEQEFWLAVIRRSHGKVIIVGSPAAIPSLDFEHVDPQTAADLLTDLGILGDRQDLVKFSEMLSGQVLALILAAKLLLSEEQSPKIRSLGRYGQVFDLNQVHRISAKVVFDRSFKRLIAKHRHLLTIASIFKRPFTLATMQAIYDENTHSSWEAFAPVSEADLQKLENLGLLRPLGQSWICEPVIQKLVPVNDAKPYHELVIKYWWTQTKPYFEWETLADLVPHLEIFKHCCTLGEFYRGFYIIQDGTAESVGQYLQAAGYHLCRLAIFKPLELVWQQSPELGTVLMGIASAYAALQMPDQAIAYYQKWLTILEQRHDPRERHTKAICLYELATLHTGETALSYFQESLGIATRSGDQALELKNLLGLANCYLQLHEYTHALEYAERHLSLARQLNHSQHESLPILVSAYRELKIYDKALEYGRMGLAAGAPPMEIQRQLADIHQLRGEYHEAQALYQECFEHYLPTDRQAQAACALGLGICSDRLGNFKEAITHLQTALDLSKGEALEPQCLIHLGHVHNSLGQSKEALGNYESSLKLLHHHPKLQAQALLGLGNVYHGLGNYVEALQLYEQARDMSGNFALEQSMAFQSLGNVHSAIGQYAEAMDMYKKALAIVRKTPESRQEISCLYSLGQVLERLGYLSQALQIYQEWMDLKKALGDQAIPKALHGSRLARPEYLKAIEFHQQLIKTKHRIGDLQGEANSYGNLANAFFSLGQYPQAVHAYQQCLEIARTIGDRRSEAKSLSGLGAAFLVLGQYGDAISLHERSLEIARKIDDVVLQAKTLNNLGKAFYALGQYGQAAAKYSEALELSQKIGNRQSEASFLGDLGNTHYALGNYQNAINFYQQWLSVAREIGDSVQSGNAFGGLGNSHNALGLYDQAAHYYHQWLNIAKENNDYRSQAHALAGLGNSYNALGKYSEAIEYHQLSLKIQRDHGDRLSDGVLWFEIIEKLEAQEQKSLTVNPYKDIQVKATAEDDSAIQQFLAAAEPKQPPTKPSKVKWRNWFNPLAKQ